MTESPPGRCRLLFLVVLLAGCGSPVATNSPSRSTAPPTPVPTAGASTPVTSPGLPVDPTLAPPPVASLAVAGRVHDGRVGSYVWAGGADSGPWLPATALARFDVPAGARADLSIEGDVPVDSWSARAARSVDTTGSSTVAIGSGSGEPTFEVPSSGAWVVAVQVVFGDGLGDATWYWHLAVD